MATVSHVEGEKVMRPDWSRRCGNAEHLEHDLGIKYQGPGWYPDAHGTCLVYPDPYCPDTGSLRVLVWNSVDPREEIRKLVELPTFPG